MLMVYGPAQVSAANRVRLMPCCVAVIMIRSCRSGAISSLNEPNERFLRFEPRFNACDQIIVLGFMKCGFQKIGILSFVPCQSPNEFDLAIINPVAGIVVHRTNLPFMLVQDSHNKPSFSRNPAV